MVGVSVKGILQEHTKRAMADAQSVGITDMTERELGYFVRAIQSNRAVAMRRLSKTNTVFLVYRNNMRCYPVYNSKFKSIVGFMAENEARYNRNERVQVWVEGRWVNGQIAYVLPAYGDPKEERVINRFRHSDVTDLYHHPSLRPQYSYLVRIEDEGGAEKIIWPPVKRIRKKVLVDERVVA